MPTESVPGWSLVIPVKALARGKSRLSAVAGPHRARLALAVAIDTVTAATACPPVGLVVVVTDDPQAAVELAGVGARVVPDVPGCGLNPALAYGASVARATAPALGVGALSADLPALRPPELARALEVAGAYPQAFVADASGSGTTLYTARPEARFRPRFGPASSRRHRQAGAHELRGDGFASLRRDVDTPDDLRAALALGVGARTARLAALLTVSPA